MVHMHKLRIDTSRQVASRNIIDRQLSIINVVIACQKASGDTSASLAAMRYESLDQRVELASGEGLRGVLEECADAASIDDVASRTGYVLSAGVGNERELRCDGVNVG